MRKGVAYLFCYREVSRQANYRYSDALAVVDDPRLQSSTSMISLHERKAHLVVGCEQSIRCPKTTFDCSRQ